MDTVDFMQAPPRVRFAHTNAEAADLILSTYSLPEVPVLEFTPETEDEENT